MECGTGESFSPHTPRARLARDNPRTLCFTPVKYLQGLFFNNCFAVKGWHTRGVVVRTFWLQQKALTKGLVAGTSRKDKSPAVFTTGDKSRGQSWFQSKRLDFRYFTRRDFLPVTSRRELSQKLVRRIWESSQCWQSRLKGVWRRGGGRRVQ